MSREKENTSTMTAVNNQNDYYAFDDVLLFYKNDEDRQLGQRKGKGL